MDEQPSTSSLDLTAAPVSVIHSDPATYSEMPVFEGSGQLVECLRILVRRPRLREAPRSSNDVRMRGLDRGIPVLCLVRAEDGGALTRALARYLARARPRRMPHVVYRYRDAHPAPPTPDHLELTRPPACYQDAADIAETLLAISRGLASGANGGGGRIRFHRFGLVRWLITQQLEKAAPSWPTTMSPMPWPTAMQEPFSGNRPLVDVFRLRRAPLLPAAYQPPYAYIATTFTSRFGNTDPQVDGHAALAYDAGREYVDAARTQCLVFNPALIAAQLRTVANTSAQGGTVRMLRINQSGRVSLAFTPADRK